MTNLLDFSNWSTFASLNFRLYDLKIYIILERMVFKKYL